MVRRNHELSQRNTIQRLKVIRPGSTKAGQQKVREHGSGALRKWQTKLRKWCKLGKEKKRKIRKEKRTNGKWGNENEMKGKRRGRGKEKERRRGQNILKNYRVTMKIVNTKYGIVNRNTFWGNVICWPKWKYKKEEF